MPSSLDFVNFDCFDCFDFGETRPGLLPLLLLAFDLGDIAGPDAFEGSRGEDGSFLLALGL